MTRAHDHAIVLGAGVGGLCAARVLAEKFAQVTVIERDKLPADDRARRGIPQGHHIHGLVTRGADLIEELFPGFAREMARDGAATVELLSEARVKYFGSILKQVPLGPHGIFASRPFLERHLRARVAALPNVTVRDGIDAAGLIATERRDRVTGVTLVPPGRDDERERVDADLIVDAMGRGARSLAWLVDLGYPRPAEDKVTIDVAYASWHYRLPAGAFGTDKVVVDGPMPERPRGMMLAAQEHDRWVLSVYGYGRGNHPPTVPEGFKAFAKAIAPPDVWEVLQNAEPDDEIAAFRYKSTTRRRYERLRELPEGLLAMGDALCTVSPIYGTGMTAAAVQACLLRNTLRQGTAHLAQRYYGAAHHALRPTWMFTALADAVLPETPGTPQFVKKVLVGHLKRTTATAAHDARIAAAVVEILGLNASPLDLLRPRLLTPILKRNPSA